jgi:hypothetical protein
MKKYLVGISYHDPESYGLWLKGYMEDYESSTGIFIWASDKEEALAWGEKIAEALFKIENPDETQSWESFGHFCWIEDDLEKSGWMHCMAFFQTVEVGVFPIIEKMRTQAYVEWCDKKA